MTSPRKIVTSDWPTRPDGSNKTMGEMTPEERKHQWAAAVERYKCRSEYYAQLAAVRGAMVQA